MSITLEQSLERGGHKKLLRLPGSDTNSAQNSINAVAIKALAAAPDVQAQLRSFFATKPPPWKVTGRKDVYQTTINGKRVAVGVDRERKKKTQDPRILALQKYRRQKEAQGQQISYLWSDEYMVGGKVCEVSPLQLGQGTRHEGKDGYGLFCDSTIATRDPFPHEAPEMNLIRFYLGIIVPFLQLHTHAREKGFCEFVHGDFKVEQFILAPKSKQRLGKPYATLILTDLPYTSHSTDHTPRMFDPSHDIHKQPYLSDELYAMHITITQLLYEALVNPLFEGETAGPLSTKHPSLFAMLIHPIKPSHLSYMAIANYEKQGYLTHTINGTTYVYPSIVNHRVRDMAQLKQLVDSIPSENLHHDPAHCLFELLEITQQGLDATLTVDGEPQKAQASVIATLEALKEHITTKYLPGTGPTGSPLTSPRDSTPQKRKLPSVD